ncbi:hypothetical protein LINGRAHAP2_LOCUS37556 [Linum grandiflorum]
MERRKALVLP